MAQLNGYLHSIRIVESDQCDCGQATETVEHLFAHCQNDTVCAIRDQIKREIKKVMNARFGPGTMPPNTFYYDDTNQENEPNEK